MFGLDGLESDMVLFTRGVGMDAFIETELTGLYRRFRTTKEIKLFIKNKILKEYKHTNIKERIALAISFLVEFAYDHKKLEQFSKIVPVYGYNDF